MKSIVIYFSRADENYISGQIQYIEKGHTEIVAEKIAEITGAPLFQVVPEVAYSDDYYYCIEEAKEDRGEDSRPAIRAYPEHMEEYDLIYLGFPTYWETMPQHMFTLLEGIDTAGKIIKPFCTHEGSGLGHSERDIARVCRDAVVRKGIAVKGSNAKDSDLLLKEWVKE